MTGLCFLPPCAVAASSGTILVKSGNCAGAVFTITLPPDAQMINHPSRGEI